MSLQKSLRNFFGISHREANGLLVLLPILVILIFSEPLFEWWWASQEADYTEEKKSLDSLVAHWPKEEIRKDIKPISKSTTAALHPFNPNEATREELISVGLSEFLAARIVNYRNKGGKFKIKNDFSKIYGLKPEQFAVLKPYIRLPDSLSASKYVKEKTSPPAISYKKNIAPLTPLTRFDINTCDTAALQKVYGIGSKFSIRIINFRNKLGGFVSLNQLNEVYGLDSSVVNKVRKTFFVGEQFSPARLKINSLTEKELAQHPYIGYKKAQQICAYRRQHGKYTSLEDIKKNPLITDEAFEKMKPYLLLE